MSDSGNPEINISETIDSLKANPYKRSALGQTEARIVDTFKNSSDRREALRSFANENETQKSLDGKELPSNWPEILPPEEELDCYDVLYDEGDDRTKPPTNAHIDRLSFEFKSGDKRLRFFAVSHQRDMAGPEDPNMTQYNVLEQHFNASPPQLVLYEGNMDGTGRQLSREEAIQLGEPAFMLYLVQKHNVKLKEGETPVVLESGDASVNQQQNEVRDPEIIRNIAAKFKNFDKVDIVFGSGHAIRDKQALVQFFDSQAAEIPIKVETD